MGKMAGIALAGAAAGAVTGLFGAGGGLMLVPLLTALAKLDDELVFPSSISIILPICLTSLIVTASAGQVDWPTALPYLFGSGLGGILAGKWGGRVPTLWLHRFLGILILWGGIRYLC